MTVDNYVAIFRTYSDMTIFIVGLADDNELILGLVLDCVHECFDRIFKGQIERRSLINNMSGVILVIDELLDGDVTITITGSPDLLTITGGNGLTDRARLELALGHARRRRRRRRRWRPSTNLGEGPGRR